MFPFLFLFFHHESGFVISILGRRFIGRESSTFFLFLFDFYDFGPMIFPLMNRAHRRDRFSIMKDRAELFLLHLAAGGDLGIFFVCLWKQ